MNAPISSYMRRAAWLLAIAPVVVLGLKASAKAQSPRVIVSGDYHAPQFSPDGSELLVHDSRMRILSTIDLKSKTTKQIAKEDAIGVTARYLADGRIVFQAKRAGHRRSIAVDPQGTLREFSGSDSKAFAHKGRIYLRNAKGPIAGSTGDTFFAPVLSPDQSMIAFTGLATGIHVHNISTGKTIRVGPGTAPSWSPDSKTIAYEWTDDDGHNLIGADLWLWDAEQGARPLTNTDAMMERHPTWSPDGKRIAFDDSKGGIYILKVGVRR